MKQYFPLIDGTVINLDAIAYFHPHPGPRLPSDKPIGIEVVFPSAGINEHGGIVHDTILLEGRDATNFLKEMDERGVDTAAIRRAAQMAP